MTKQTLSKEELVSKIATDFSSTFARIFIYESAIENPDEYHKWFNACPNTHQFINKIRDEILLPILEKDLH